MIRTASIVPIILSLAGSVAAQERPIVVPTQDVDVTYRAGTVEQRMRWLVAEQRLRIDPPGAGVFMIVDYRTHRMQMVRLSDRKIVDLPSPANLPGSASATGYTKQGTGSVAGLACTEWQTRDVAGDDATVCLTADGVMLRAEHGGTVLVEATHVAYAAQDPADFRPPAGFTFIAPPPLPAAPTIP